MDLKISKMLNIHSWAQFPDSMYFSTTLIQLFLPIKRSLQEDKLEVLVYVDASLQVCIHKLYLNVPEKRVKTSTSTSKQNYSN